jgi:prepilin signal peptidase PulO-like enzyme (type II secretory pathway)
VLEVPVYTMIGFLLGWASWVVAVRLTAGARGGALSSRGLLLLSGLSGSGVLAASAVRSGGNVATVAVVALLAIPLLITLLTDILARLIFPAVLMPGLLLALVVAATGPQGVVPAFISGGGAATAAAVLVAASRWIWSGAEEPPLGSGEILIAATIGAMLGPNDTPIVLFAGMVLGAAAAGLLLRTRRAQREDAIPYGAFLCGSALVALAL